MVKNIPAYLTPLILSLFSISLSAQDGGCEGFRTQTQGGWGTSANGNNPGVYRDANFEDAFPEGITLGCDFEMEFQTSADVEAFLPSGGTARALTEDLVNPVGYGNVLAGQLLALTLSVGFDQADPNFSESDFALSELTVHSGSFEGYTVSEILEIGNQVLGGCASDFSPSEINSVLSSINENYVDGEGNNGFLDCPEAIGECALDLLGMSNECTESNTYLLSVELVGANGSFEVISDNALSIEPSALCFGGDVLGGTTVSVTLEFPSGADYQFSVLPAENVDCDQSADIDCGLTDIAGVAPTCCSLSIDCGTVDQVIYSCISDLPEVESGVTFSAEGCGEVSVQLTEKTQGTGCQNSPLILTRTYTVTNGTAMQSCTQTFTIIDDEAPIITCPPDENAICGSAGVPQIFATATDNCDDELSITYTNGVPQGCGFFVRTWTATDDCGNTATCTQNVFVEDTEGPVINTAGDLIVDCGTDLNPTFLGLPQVSDACSSFEFFYEDTESIIDECSSTVTRVWTATDACGNVSTAQQTITVADLSGPVIIGAPGNQNFQCVEIPEAPEVYAVDQCSGDTVEVEMEEFITESGCLKTVLRTFTAQDACGNSSSLSSNITIQDTQGPQLTCPTDVLLPCGEENIDPSVIGIAEAIDACSETFVTITYDDSEYQTNVCPPRIVRTWTAVDTCGNASNCEQMIMFDDQEAPVIECLEDITINCSEATTDPEFTGTPIAEDACGEAFLEYIDGPFDGNCPASFVRTWEAADACGNASFCYQVITVIDEVAPDLVCPPTATVSCGASFEPYNTGMATASDQCLDVFLSYVDGELTGDCEKQFTRTWTATDACDNSTSCDQLIIVVDQMNPYITCPPDASIECGGNTDPSLLGVATAVDYCSDVEVTYQDVEDFSSCIPTILRTWTATDICGNMDTCVQIIEVTGGGEIELTCPDDVTISCTDEADPVITGTATATAACGEISISYSDSIVPAGETEGGDCGQLRTQTQGGWGAPANGGNPGTYRDANFDDAFPEGLVIGCDFTLTLSSSSAVQDFLPSGGPISILEEDLIDPNNYSSVLAGQLVAATLSVGFDETDESFSASEANLGDYTFASGPMAGMSVNEILAEANSLIGGCGSAFSGSVLNTTLTAINESFVDGTGQGGSLNCPETNGSDNCTVIYRTWTATDACGNTVSCVQIITQSDELSGLLSGPEMSVFPSPATSVVNFEVDENKIVAGTLTIVNISGVIVHREFLQPGNGIIQVDLSGYRDGVYSVNFQTGEHTYTTKFVKM